MATIYVVTTGDGGSDRLEVVAAFSESAKAEAWTERFSALNRYPEYESGTHRCAFVSPVEIDAAPPLNPVLHAHVTEGGGMLHLRISTSLPAALCWGFSGGTGKTLCVCLAGEDVAAFQAAATRIYERVKALGPWGDEATLSAFKAEEARA